MVQLEVQDTLKEPPGVCEVKEMQLLMEELQYFCVLEVVLVILRLHLLRVLG